MRSGCTDATVITGENQAIEAASKDAAAAGDWIKAEPRTLRARSATWTRPRCRRWRRRKCHGPVARWAGFTSNSGSPLHTSNRRFGTRTALFYDRDDDAEDRTLGHAGSLRLDELNRIGIAIIDLHAHRARIWEPDNYGFLRFPDDGREGVRAASDRFGHGTHIAGLIGASGPSSRLPLQGIAPRVADLAQGLDDD